MSACRDTKRVLDCGAWLCNGQTVSNLGYWIFLHTAPSLVSVENQCVEMEPAQRHRWYLQMMTEDKSWSSLCPEIAWRFSARPRRRHSRGIRQLIMQLICRQATVRHMGGLPFSWTEFSRTKLSWLELSWMELSWMELSWMELSWMELSRMELRWMECSRVEQYGYLAIAWNDIMCSWSRIVDLGSKIWSHMDASITGYALTRDNMSPDWLWDCNEAWMEDGHYGGQ